MISNEEMEDIMKRVKSLEESRLSKGISQTIENETKEKKGMLLGTLGTILLGNMLAGKHASKEQGVITAREGIVKVGHDF